MPRGSSGRAIETLRDAALTFFSHPGPRLLAALGLVSFAGRSALGRATSGDLAVVVLIAVYWPIQEWVVHRYLLHVKPSAAFDPWFARVHRAHHRDPADLELALLPMRVLWVAMPANAALWLLLSPGLPRALTGIGASSFMGLIYEWSHFLVHTLYKPKTPWFRRVRRNHRLHHFHNERYWYGFTATIVDRVLRTDPDPKAVPHSATARDLHALGDETV